MTNTIVIARMVQEKYHSCVKPDPPKPQKKQMLTNGEYLLTSFLKSKTVLVNTFIYNTQN